MKIAILGAGAMGSLYGGPLSTKNDVWFIDIWEEHIKNINNKGLIVKVGKNEILYHPKAVKNAKIVGKSDLVIVFVKSIDTAEALKNNKELFGENTLVLTLQNGYGNDKDILPYVKKDNLFIGTSLCGATMLKPGYVLQAGRGVTSIGILEGGSLDKAKSIADLLNEVGFETHVLENVMEVVWKKLLVNVGLNAVLALLDVRNGFLGDSKTTFDIGLKLLKEGVLVARAEGYIFDADKMAEQYYIEQNKVMGQNICSMLQDVRKKRKTEIERINGPIVELGRRHNIQTPYNELIVRLINAKEETYTYI